MLNNPSNTDPPTYTPQLHDDQHIQYWLYHRHTTTTCWTTQTVQTLPLTHHCYMLTILFSTDPTTYKPHLNAKQPTQYRPYHLHNTITCWPTHPFQTHPPTHNNYTLTNPSNTDSPNYTQFHAKKPIQYRNCLLHNNYMLKNLSSSDTPTYTPQFHAVQPIQYGLFHLHTTITCWTQYTQTLPPTHHNCMRTNPTSTDPPSYTPITCWPTQPIQNLTPTQPVQTLPPTHKLHADQPTQ